MKRVATVVILAILTISTGSAGADEPDCSKDMVEILKRDYNDGQIELVKLDGPYSWNRDGKKRQAYVVTYCTVGDVTSKAKRKAQCRKSRRKEIRIATCSSAGIVDDNGDKFVDLSDLTRSTSR
jgi:hypothetical protein